MLVAFGAVVRNPIGEETSSKGGDFSTNRLLIKEIFTFTDFAFILFSIRKLAILSTYGFANSIQCSIKK